MSEVAERFRNLSAGFTERATAVPGDAWDNPAPCEGWVARDVVRHLVEWLPGFFFGAWDIEAPTIASVDEDPVGAWTAVRDTIQAGLDDPEVATLERESPGGQKTFEDAIAMFCLADILIHTWDLARATGLDETLDADEVHRFAADMESMDPSMDEHMRSSGHYGPRVDVPADSGEQTRLLAFMGRTP
jgi:uncharacterized protein (TIGR03086 family)